MKRESCTDCVCLIEDDNGTWVCDECGKPCAEIKRCPETGEEEGNAN